MAIAAHRDHMNHVSGCGPVGIPEREAELDAIVGDYGVDALRHGGDQGAEDAVVMTRVAFFTNWITANLLVWSTQTKRKSLTSAVWTSAMLIWK